MYLFKTKWILVNMKHIEPKMSPDELNILGLYVPQEASKDK